MLLTLFYSDYDFPLPKLNNTEKIIIYFIDLPKKSEF